MTADDYKPKARAWLNRRDLNCARPEICEQGAACVCDGHVADLAALLAEVAGEARRDALAGSVLAYPVPKSEPNLPPSNLFPKEPSS